MITLLHFNTHMIVGDGYSCFFDDVEVVFERGASVFRIGMDSGWDETNLEVDVNTFGRESETLEACKFIGVRADTVLSRYQNETSFRVSCAACMRTWDSVPTAVREGAEEEVVSISTSVMLSK